MEWNELNASLTRGFWGDVWDAVKSGTLKWAEADLEGAIGGVMACGLLSQVAAPLTATAGAAAGSVIGAVKNFFD